MLSNRSQAHLKLKQFAEAERDADEALRIDGEHLKSLLRRGNARLKLGKPKAARQDLSAVLEAEP